jgi:hypothetical protein
MAAATFEGKPVDVDVARLGSRIRRRWRLTWIDWGWHGPTTQTEMVCQGISVTADFALPGRNQYGGP